MPSIVHSTFAAEELCREIAARYAIGEYRQSVLWRAFINDVYRLDAGERRWWLRVAPEGWRSARETQAEINVLLAIAQVDDIAVRPVPLTDGRYVSTVSAPEGDRTVVLFEHAPGAPLSFIGEDGVKNARRYGEAEGRLHAACEFLPTFTVRPPFDAETTIRVPSNAITAALLEAEAPDFNRIVSRIQAAVRQRSGLTIGFCHGDLNSENIHFDGGRIRAIDFDLCADGLRAFELAAFSKGVTHGSREAANRLIGAFLDGYHRFGRTTDEDLAALPAMILAQRIWVGAIHMALAPRMGAQGFGRAYVERLLTWLRDWETILDTAPSWART